MKVTIESVIEELRESGVPPTTISAVVKKLEKAASDEKAAKEPSARSKSQYVFILSDPEGKLAVAQIDDMVGWVVTMEDTAAPQTALERIKTGIANYHNTRKGRLYPAKTVGEAMELIRPKNLKGNREDEKTTVKTKTPVLVVVTDNLL